MFRPKMFRHIANRIRCGWRLGILAAVLCCGPIGAQEGAEQDQEAVRELGLKNMKRSAAEYALSSGGAQPQAFKFHETPYLRSSNPIGGTKDGVLFLWTNHGRPAAVLKLYTFNNRIYSHAWLSLSEGSFVGERGGQVFWNPAPGIQWREVPDAPLPAETAPQRLRQIKTLAEKFTATYTALSSDGKPFELRLLTQPLLRYETDDDYRADGALFTHVQTTGAVGFLLLESRHTSAGHRWHYAYTSVTTGQVTARYGDQPVFSIERGNSHQDPKQPYLLLHSQPVPAE